MSEQEPVHATRSIADPVEAVAYLKTIYDANTAYLRAAFERFSTDRDLARRVSAHYPFIRITTEEITQLDKRLSYGFVSGPGSYQTTVTRPDLFENYYIEQLHRLAHNHGVAFEVGVSDEPIPVHFAYQDGVYLEGDLDQTHLRAMRTVFDVPDLATMDDSIVNGTRDPLPDEILPLALFTAPRVDYSLHRLRHYTATTPENFQNYVLFTNYQFYIDEFVELGRELMSASDDPAVREYRSQYTAFVEPGNVTHWNQNIEARAAEGTAPGRLPQMPAYHLVRPDNTGITMVNIGVGPSNAKTITDHIAVLRPHAWIMLGHCAGLRNSQRLGDYCLAHGYVREDHVLDDDLPLWVPVPPLAEVQVALERAVADVTQLDDFELKRVMRTGTVVTVDNRNWELRDHREPVQRMSQSRAIALDMESATIAANGFRFRVPYGTLLCVSDKPLHGELKLPGMADRFYRERVDQHLKIGVKAMELLRDNGLDRLHSRKLRSFNEVAFQ
ncbi:AMP nucleosidase [Pandoraea pulmonicola]|uniref:AMP nucleosidase n=1 Tax=Pandoraea pulmonicola TaxID=93221 RepID=A0AAJ5CZQ5_PANPU|nr:AMP nucleosidase [Pandoraea pulmonicola]AJC21430.1 AMP nucleosidase [Pandoraea pulmonicola]SUA89812.1 AMP nucleosidase [Pandoraea pulmonicola]